MLVKPLRFLIFAAMITFICYQAAAGQSASITPLPDGGTPTSLTASLNRVAGRSIAVTVNNEGAGSWGGGAWPGMPIISIGRTAFTDATHGGGHGLMVLLHELGHTTGITNEAKANCYALDHLLPFIRATWDIGDPWQHQLANAYAEATASMLQQSAVYQCNPSS